MALVKHVALELLIKCKEMNIDYDYYKIQKLAYVCQCVHFAKYGVPLSPEKIFNWSYGAGFREIYRLFYSEKSSNDLLNKCNKKTYDILNVEMETIDYVMLNYGNKKADELIETTKKDPLYSTLEIGDCIILSKLNDLFISEKDINLNLNDVTNKIRRLRINTNE